MKIWEDKAIELFKQGLLEVTVLDRLQNEMNKAGIFSGDKFLEQRVDMAQQIINNIKDK